MNKIVVGMLIALIFSCVNSSTDVNQSDYLAELKKLKTIESQKVFLENIYALDQKVRTDGTAVEMKYGYDSQESKAATKLMMETDEINLAKISNYLKMYGHPKIDTHGELASSTPWLVIHHSDSRFGARREFFDILYKAYLAEDLSGGVFTFYLNRMYRIESGQRLDISGPFTEQMEVDTLIQLLEIEMK